MTKVYVVMGSTGEYSSKSEWPVLAFSTKERAAEHEHKADVRAKEIERTKDAKDSKYGGYDPEEHGRNEFDPGMRMDYTGTSYYTVEVELVE